MFDGWWASGWVGKFGNIAFLSHFGYKQVPEGRKEGIKTTSVKPQVRRKRGKLSKKEGKELKKKNQHISWLLDPPPPKEVINHEKTIAREMEEIERIDEEREDRLERIRRRKLEWKARRVHKTMVETDNGLVRGVHGREGRRADSGHRSR